MSDFASCVSTKSDRSKGKPQSVVHHRPEYQTDTDTHLSSLASLLAVRNPNLHILVMGTNGSLTEIKEGDIRSTSAEKIRAETSCQTTPGQKTSCQTTSGQSVSLQEDLKVYKVTLDGLDQVTYNAEVPSISTIYTDLHLSAGGSEGVNQKHEVWQLDTAFKMKSRAIFKTILPGRDKRSRRVLTTGIAGIGKTFAARKFALDWARGLENQDIILLVPITFRELNLVRDEQHSLLSLIHVFHPTLKKVTAEHLAAWKVAFIFDGLEEGKFSLEFENIDIDSDAFDNKDVISDVTVTSSVGVLLANLIKGNLLPSALFWITSRPEAADQIPLACVDMVTEIRGFTDPQKEEFFRKTFSDDEELASTVISHVKTSKSIHILCHIPVYCWMAATVVEDLVRTGKTGQLPKNLAGMLSHFVSIQKRRRDMYNETREVKSKEQKPKETKSNPKEKTKEKRKRDTFMETDMDVLLKLGKQAFEDLAKGIVW